jgi:hypothetical protein
MKDESAGSGSFFPVTAAQRFDLQEEATGVITNSVHLPFIAAMQFGGSYEMKGVRELAFFGCHPCFPWTSHGTLWCHESWSMHASKAPRLTRGRSAGRS